MRTTVFLGGPRKIRPACERNTSAPNDIAACGNGRCKKLIFEISVTESDAFYQLNDSCCLSHIPRQWFFAGQTFKRSAPAFNRRHDLFDILDTRVIRPAEPDGLDFGIGNHVADRAIDSGLTDIERVREEAAARGVDVATGELVGLVPAAVLDAAMSANALVPGVDASQVLENVLASRLAE